MRAPLSERGDDLYQTPPEAIRALLAVEDIPQMVWEPACGPGAIARELRDAGRVVLATDLVDYESPDQDYANVDFLIPGLAESVWAEWSERRSKNESLRSGPVIVTNPPFKTVEPFVARALDLASVVIMLLRLAFLESGRRRSLLDDAPLARVWVFRKRLPMMHRAGWEGRKANSGMPFAWFVWRRDYVGSAELRRLSWEEYQ